MNQININIEGFNVNGICVGCLNYNRKMYSSTNVQECFRILGNIEVTDGLMIQVCWECLATVKKICNFQSMIQTSYCILMQYSKKNTFLNSPNDLSQHAVINLSQTQPIITEYLMDVLNIETEDYCGLVKDEIEIINNIEDEINASMEQSSDEEQLALVKIKKDKKHMKRKCDIQSESNKKLKKSTENKVIQLQDKLPELITESVKVDLPSAIDNNKILNEMNEVKVEMNEDFEDENNLYENDSHDFKLEDPESSDDDVQLSKLKKKHVKKLHKKERRKRDGNKIKTDLKKIRKLKNLPEDKVELISFDEEKMLEIRKQDILHPNFVKLKYKCDLCITGFNTEKLMELHNSRKHVASKNKEQSKCDICNALYLSKDNMAAHRAQHYNGYHCRLCGYETGIKKLIMIHCNRLHKDVIDEFTCSMCKKKFSSKNKLLYHRSVCDQERPQCDCCGKVFANKMTLKYHRKEAGDKQETKPKENVYLPCKGCDKVFYTRKSYRAHVVIHDGLEYPCPICGKLFQWKRNLARHIRNHSEKDTGLYYECTTCRKRFSSKDCYNNHMKFSKKHVTEDNYNHECSYCGKKFPTKWCMVDHIDWDHLKKIKYQCQTCLKAFKTAKIMVAHINNIHGGKKEPEGEHLCDICGKSYTTVKRLKGHIWAMHTHRSTMKSYKCKLCPATFTWQTSIYKHMNIMHDTTKVTANSVKSNVLHSKKSKAVKIEPPPFDGVEVTRNVQYYGLEGAVVEWHSVRFANDRPAQTSSANVTS